MKLRSYDSALILLITFFATLDITTCASKEPKCKETMKATSVVRRTYEIHFSYERIGIGHDLIFQFYNHALLSLCRPECVCGPREIERNCFNEEFSEDLDYATLQLWLLVADDWDKPEGSRLFPDVYSFDDLPDPPLEVEQWAARENKLKTEKSFENAVQRVYETKQKLGHHEHLAHLPADTLIRYDSMKEVACEEYRQKVNSHSLTLSAPSLTAYVFGVANQMLLCSGKSEVARVVNNEIVGNMLKEHVRLTYNAARCLRNTGYQLQVPTIYLDQVVATAHLVLLNATLESSSTLLSSIPPLTAMRDIVRLGRSYFPDVIGRMSGMASNGMTKYVTWTGSTLIVENIQDVLLRNMSLLEVGGFGGNMDEEQKPSWTSGHRYNCPIKFRAVNRLDHVEEDDLCCCSESCIRTSGNVFDVFVMNEMCCFACNAHHCNLMELDKVLQVQANYARSQQWSVEEDV